MLPVFTNPRNRLSLSYHNSPGVFPLTFVKILELNPSSTPPCPERTRPYTSTCRTPYNSCTFIGHLLKHSQVAYPGGFYFYYNAQSRYSSVNHGRGARKQVYPDFHNYGFPISGRVCIASRRTWDKP